MLGIPTHTPGREEPQFFSAGLMLPAGSDPRNPRELYYWHREARQSNAEIDYVIQHGTEVLPIEVKSGGSGSMQSLHRFMQEREVQSGIRTSLENFGEIGPIHIVPLYALASHLD